MYKVIRELWRFSALPQTQASAEVPICKEFYHFVACEFRCARMYNLQTRAGLDLCEWDRMECSCEVFLLPLLYFLDLVR